MRKREAVRGLAVALAVLAPGLALPGSVGADDPELCRPEVPELDKYAYLRALSLDLRGVVPTVEEYELLDDLDDVPSELVDEWMATPEFQRRVVRHHRSLLWPNVTNQDIVHFRRALRTISNDVPIWYRPSAADSTRGANNTPCADRPATYDADGDIEFETVGELRIEGWVEVEPYWAPGTTVKVCAFDAREDYYSPSGGDCSTRDTAYAAQCGCGPGLQWCMPTGLETNLTRYFAEDVERRIAANVAADEPYTGILTGRRAFVNGPLAYFWRHQTALYNQVPLEPVAVDHEHLPDLPYAEPDVWEEIELSEHHGGVLTSPVYLLRFQTNRARANRFYDAFLCQPFQPPAGGIPVDDEGGQRQPDVQRRDGCKYCHAILEPAAAHWGRWTQQGGGFLSPELYPVFRDDCADCARGFEACSEDCSLHYVTRALSPEEEPYLGMLRAFEFLRPEHQAYVDEGPAELVRQGLVSNQIPACTVRRTAQWLIGRDPEEREEAWADDLVRRFIGTDFRYREVVAAIVASETYRRVR